MISLTADETLQNKLGKLTEPTEIRDPSGTILGYFTPATQPESPLYKLAAAQFDAEEMNRRKAMGKIGYTTPQVLDHLKALEKNGCATP